MSALVVGVDPGGRETGVVLRSGEKAVRAALVTRGPIQTLSSYIREVVEQVSEYHAACYDPDMPIALENVKPPNPHLGLSNVAGLLDTAVVVGAVLHAFPDAILVEPAKHGSAPLSSYPAELVGAREKQGTGKRRHLRSAWDVAGSVCGGV